MKTDIYNATRQRIPKSILYRAAVIAGRRLKFGRRSVSVAFVTEARMRALNRHYRGQDRVTDILSFAEAEASEAGYLGELVICYRQIQRQAVRQNWSVRAELAFIFVHGLLHLAGYDDATESGWQEMNRLGTQLCKSII